MKQRIWLLTAVAVAWLCGGAAGAEDGFYVIAGGKPAGTEITSVPYTITKPGFYYLGRNLDYGGNNKAITVEADYVTLDLMGRTLNYTGSGPATTGIDLLGRTYVEIRNGTVSGFKWGVYESSLNGANHRVINIRANYNTHDGILLYGNNHLVQGCTASNNGVNGIWIDSGTITSSVASDNNQYGIVLRGPGSLLDNIANNCGTAGFVIDQNANIVVDGNGAGGNGINYYLGGGNTCWGVNAGR
jgi:hypothetical protein